MDKQDSGKKELLHHKDTTAGVFVKWLAALFVRTHTTGSWALQNC